MLFPIRTFVQKRDFCFVLNLSDLFTKHCELWSHDDVGPAVSLRSISEISKLLIRKFDECGAVGDLRSQLDASLKRPDLQSVSSGMGLPAFKRRSNG